MSDVQDYNSSLSDAAQSRKYETFSYLPTLTKESTRAQIQYIVDKGWNPGIEHTEPENAVSNYWYMWKLPMFGEKSADSVMKRLNECRDANPGHHIRLSGHNPIRQTREASFVVFRATG